MKSRIERMRPLREHIIYYNLLAKCGNLFYKKYHKKFIKVKCPACKSNSCKFLFIKYGFSHFKCSLCKTLFCSPRPTEDLLLTYYTEFESSLYLNKILLKTDINRNILQDQPRVKIILKFLKKVFKKKQIIAADIGAGIGSFSQCLKNSNFFKNVIVFDLNETSVQSCLKQGLEARQGTVDDIEDNSMGFLVMNNLIEHLFNPLLFLKKCYKKMINNGLIAISAPNGQGFDFQILKEKTVNITPPEHLNYFNPYSIELLMKRAGFSILKIETPGVLDVQIVLREIENNNIKLDKDNKFLHYLLLKTSSTIHNAFQIFLQENLLSSHMLIIAQKKSKKNE